MRLVMLYALGGLVCAQTPQPAADPAYAPLARAYDALREHDYDAAVTGFLEGINGLRNVRQSIKTWHTRI